MVILSHDIRGADGTPLRAAGYSFQYWTAAAPNAGPFQLDGVLHVRTIPNQRTRSYGGVATDFNNDGWLDLTIVNEDSADLRVFLNRADGSGMFQPFLQPPAPIGLTASPNEPSDFDRDGNADLAVANESSDSVSIVLGRGDGTFLPAGSPRRRDAAGSPCSTSTAMSTSSARAPRARAIVLLNDGHGVFRATFYETGGTAGCARSRGQERDGILDLVTGIGGGGPASS
jgi:hypothetical protein